MSPAVSPCLPTALDRAGARAVASTLGALAGATALGAALGLLDPGLFPAGPPHPTLHPTLGAIASILATNLRVLCAPYVLIALSFNASRAGRLAGDGIVAAALGANALRVGLALGRWQDRLLPYLPHLPLEYLAAATAGGAWLAARRRARPGRLPLASVAVTTLLLGAAASAEVLLTPHAS